MFRVLLLQVALVIAVASAIKFKRPEDPCGVYLSCKTCVAEPLCGWCSYPVVFPGNITGPQCAGFSPNGSTPFVCNGIYSTQMCVAGYVCDQESFQCKLGEPGEGNTYDKCRENCTNDGKVYLCNVSTHKCYAVPPGTPGAASLDVCTKNCIHITPTSHTSTPHPTHPAQTYECNYTTGECDPAEPGHGSSKDVCEQACQKSNDTYFCNQFLSKCVKLPKGTPGKSLEECEKQCSPKPKPGPPPNFKKGIYRGVQIQKNYEIGEFQMEVNETIVVLVSIVHGKITRMSGTPSHIPDSEKMEMWITFDDGKIIKTISDDSGQPGPETTFMTTAMGAMGGAVPSTITAAMTDPNDAVLAFAKCLTDTCIFTLASSANTMLSAVSEKLQMSDHCSQYYHNCSECIAQKYCGWCSQPVTYKDGTQGTQCAGFNPDSTPDAFVCIGRYSTVDCTVGYSCSDKYTCVPAAPGNGLPLKECEQLCHPTPPPTPPPQQYVCNVTEKQCFKCNHTNCPGSLPLGPCEDACTHPKPGPHGDLIGVWRGIHIENDYVVGEVEYVFNKTSLNVYHDSVYQYCTNITSLGSDAMLMTIMDGKHKGWSFGAIYQLAAQYKGLYQYATFARGKLGQGFPASYEEAETTQGMEVLTLVKCTTPPCSFNPP